MFADSRMPGLQTFQDGIKLLLFVTAIVVAAGYAHADNNNVRVRLVHTQSSVTFKAQNLILIDRKGVRVDFSEDSNWAEVTIKWQDALSESRLIARVGKKGKRIEVVSGLRFPIEIRAQEIQLQDKLVPPHLWVNWAMGSYEVVAQLTLFDYLFGVLMREMPGSWPMEALKAQAVAARSYTLAQMKFRAGETFDLEGNILDQDFEWIHEDRRQSAVHERWKTALKATDRWILMTPENDILKAYYHADCGGQTTTPDLVWGSTNFYQSVKDSVCESRKENQWQTVVEKNWLKKQLTSGFDVLRTKIDLQFDWIQSLFDRRVTLVEWWQSPESMHLMTGQNFRQLIGFGKLKSTRFTSQDLGQTIRFSGKGSGHGVGLCQWGTKEWAARGLSAQKILAHYYPLAKLYALPDLKKPQAAAASKNNLQSRAPKAQPTPPGFDLAQEVRKRNEEARNAEKSISSRATSAAVK